MIPVVVVDVKPREVTSERIADVDSRAGLRSSYSFAS